MSRAGLGSGGRWVVMGIAAAAIALVELASPARGGGALLVTLVIWTAVAQGSVAVVAAAELTNARWLASVRQELLSPVRLLPLLLLLFLLLWPQLGLYRWSAEPGAWLNRPFFFGRNVALLAAVAGAGTLFAGWSLRGHPAVKRLAVGYLFLFAASQTLVAFDWVMSLSWPFVSSMLGMFFTVEAFYSGVASAGILFALLGARGRGAHGEAFGAAGRDVGLLLFGFSILWGGLFFAQFITLWYGNLPEEVGWVAVRAAASPTRELGPAFIAACFAVPFLTLIPEWTKAHRAVVAAVAVAVLLGQVAERLYLMQPELALRPWAVVVENLLLAGVWWVTVVMERPPPRVGEGARGGVA